MADATNKGDAPAIITCANCGHRATTRARGFPALTVAQLAGKTLVCISCGTRQHVDLAQVVEAVHREHAPQIEDDPKPRAKPATKRQKTVSALH
jgi:hypothetical protein